MGLRLRETIGFILFMMFLGGCVAAAGLQTSLALGIIAGAAVILATVVCVWCMVSHE